MLLEKVGRAFNGNDIDAVMKCFAPDAIFDHASGPEAYSTRFEGHDALKKVFNGLFEIVQSVSWETIDERICGDQAFCQYSISVNKHSGD